MIDKEQIIKALENCNADGDCSVCPYERARFPDELECTEELHADALSLIRELTEENEMLKTDMFAIDQITKEILEEINEQRKAD